MPQRDTDVWPDNWKESLVAVLALAIIAIQFLWLTAPGLPFQLADAVGGPVDVRDVEPVDDSLVIADADVRYINRIFREQTNEVVYCGIVDDGRIRPWLATLVENSPESASFRTQNCPVEEDQELANIHTHPDGASGLSTADERLIADPRYDYVCVQTAAIEETPDGADHLVCYTRSASGATRRVPVVIR